MSGIRGFYDVFIRALNCFIIRVIQGLSGCVAFWHFRLYDFGFRIALSKHTCFWCCFVWSELGFEFSFRRRVKGAFLRVQQLLTP